MDWITGEKFKGIADFTYSPFRKHRDDYDNLPNTFLVQPLKERNIVYTHTMYCPHLLDLMESITAEFILITHSCDYKIEKGQIVRPNGAGEVEQIFPVIFPSNVIKWYSKNINVIDPRIESIPIGLENERWFPNIHKKQQMLEKLKEPQRYRNLVYMNHNVNTNTERAKLYEFFGKKRWVTTVWGTNGKRFHEYLDALYNHKFVISPEGNGIDTHRTWECLYMGVIPIEKRNLNNRFYTDLPICFVDDWNEITEDFLNKEFDRIKSSTWNMEKLSFNYWKNKIQNS